MATNKRPNLSTFLSTSAKALETEKDLKSAKNQIAALEDELSATRIKLQSQIGDTPVQHSLVPISVIQRRPYQSRREKDPQVFAEIVHSIKTYGFRGSIWIQRLQDGNMRLIAGETRLDAAIEAELTEISADIVEVDDITAVKLSRIENARRKSLNALDDTEELLYLLMLTLNKDRPNTIKSLYQYKNASEGKSSIDTKLQTIIESVFNEVAPDISLKTFITSRLPLLELPDDVLKAYNSGKLQYTKATILGRIQEKELRKELLEEVIEVDLSLAALKARVNPNIKQTKIIYQFNKAHEQISNLNQKSISSFSIEERSQLKKTLLELQATLQKKLNELEEI